jgi:hypothetical protein
MPGQCHQLILQPGASCRCGAGFGTFSVLDLLGWYTQHMGAHSSHVVPMCMPLCPRFFLGVCVTTGYFHR